MAGNPECKKYGRYGKIYQNGRSGNVENMRNSKERLLWMRWKVWQLWKYKKVTISGMEWSASNLRWRALIQLKGERVDVIYLWLKEWHNRPVYMYAATFVHVTRHPTRPRGYAMFGRWMHIANVALNFDVSHIMRDIFSRATILGQMVKCVNRSYSSRPFIAPRPGYIFASEGSPHSQNKRNWKNSVTSEKIVVHSCSQLSAMFGKRVLLRDTYEKRERATEIIRGCLFLEALGERYSTLIFSGMGLVDSIKRMKLTGVPN